MARSGRESTAFHGAAAARLCAAPAVFVRVVLALGRAAIAKLRARAAQLIGGLCPKREHPHAGGTGLCALHAEADALTQLADIVLAEACDRADLAGDEALDTGSDAVAGLRGCALQVLPEIHGYHGALRIGVVDRVKVVLHRLCRSGRSSVGTVGVGCLWSMIGCRLSAVGSPLPLAGSLVGSRLRCSGVTRPVWRICARTSRRRREDGGLSVVAAAGRTRAVRWHREQRCRNPSRFVSAAQAAGPPASRGRRHAAVGVSSTRRRLGHGRVRLTVGIMAEAPEFLTPPAAVSDRGWTGDRGPTVTVRRLLVVQPVAVADRDPFGELGLPTAPDLERVLAAFEGLAGPA
jgi:hypothetical protein